MLIKVVSFCDFAAREGREMEKYSGCGRTEQQQTTGNLKKKRMVLPGQGTQDILDRLA